MESVLVTGCAGFIGSHLTEALLKNGYRVVGIDNYDAFYNILFGGYMGNLKAGDMLPSDYFQTIKESH